MAPIALADRKWARPWNSQAPHPLREWVAQTAMADPPAHFRSSRRAPRASLPPSPPRAPRLLQPSPLFDAAALALPRCLGLAALRCPAETAMSIVRPADREGGNAPYRPLFRSQPRLRAIGHVCSSRGSASAAPISNALMCAAGRLEGEGSEGGSDALEPPRRSKMGGDVGWGCLSGPGPAADRSGLRVTQPPPIFERRG
jgi:hypothetical protein